jgi:hypothetical protein
VTPALVSPAGHDTPCARELQLQRQKVLNAVRLPLAQGGLNAGPSQFGSDITILRAHLAQSSMQGQGAEVRKLLAELDVAEQRVGGVVGRLYGERTWAGSTANGPRRAPAAARPGCAPRSRRRPSASWRPRTSSRWAPASRAARLLPAKSGRLDCPA